MLRTALCLTTLALVAGSAAGLRGEEKSPHQIKLFNGKDLSGWTCYLRQPGAKMEDTWSVAEGGLLGCTGKPIGYLRTEKKFTSFRLQVEWRWPPQAQPGNSGVLLRMVGEDKVWPKSIEAQLAAQNAGDIWNIDKFNLTVDPQRTKGRRTIKLNPSNEKPVGQWNLYEITLHGGDLLLKVNGVVQNQATHVEVLPGYIGLQSEGAPIEFRNITLIPLDD